MQLKKRIVSLHRSKLQVIRMLVTVLVVFIICWTPQQIFVFYSAIYPEEYNQVQFTIMELVIRILSNKNVFEPESQHTLQPLQYLTSFWFYTLRTMRFVVVVNIIIHSETSRR